MTRTEPPRVFTEPLYGFIAPHLRKSKQETNAPKQHSRLVQENANSARCQPAFRGKRRLDVRYAPKIAHFTHQFGINSLKPRFVFSFPFGHKGSVRSEAAIKTYIFLNSKDGNSFATKKIPEHLS